MPTMAGFPEAIRALSEAYAQTLAVMARALESLPSQDGETRRRLGEQWLAVARSSKDAYVAALEQGFTLWESECRRLAGAAAAPAARPAPANPFEAWAETWKRSAEAFAAGGPPGTPGAEAVRKQAEAAQQAMQEGLRAWQRLISPPRAKP